MRGAYLITDNGYAEWRIMQCPVKFSTNQKELMWSTRLESVRKDVECTFGVLKARFRILQSRIKFQHQSKVDNVFVSSCILHNMNLVHDEFDVNWKDPANWETPDNEDDQDLREGRELLRIRGRLLDPNDAILNVIPVLDDQRNVVVEDIEEVDVSYFDFRSELVEHYNYCSKNSLVEWI